MQKEIAELKHSHWEEVKRIYEEGIRSGNATFETTAPSWDDWHKKHHESLRFVCIRDGVVAGWAALIPTSIRKVYSGVMEVTIYVGEDFRGRGVGKALMERLITESEKRNVWSLLSVLFPENTASIKLHESMGFRSIGIREKMGNMNGVWRDNLMMERRSKVVGFNPSQEDNLVIETDRLILKVVNESIADPYNEFLIRNKDFHSEWVPLRHEDFYSVEYTRKILRDYYWQFKNKNALRLYYSKKDDIENIIGEVSLSQIIYGPFRSCYLSYIQDGSELGSGYAAEAVSAVVKYAFEELKLHRIEANIMPRNEKSIKLVERLGFKYEGSSEKYLEINGKWEDHLHYIMLNQAVE